MKKLKFKIKLKWLIPFSALIVLLFIIPLIFTDKEESENLNVYKMQLVYNEQSHTLEGKESVTYYNNSENMFTHLYFHLYPNAFREGAENKVVSSTKTQDAYPNGESYGQIDIVRVYNNQRDLNFEITGEDENILMIELEEAIYPDESAEINIDFLTSLANINHRLGYGENTINFGNFYPIACVYEDGKGFSQSLYHSNGDPFYSDCANYEVSISYNSKYIIASSGELEKTTTSNGTCEQTYKGKNIRDFCFVLSDNLKMTSKKVDGIEIEYYGYKNDQNLDKCLQVAVDAVKTFNDMFGKYPYKQLSIVKANFVHGGMEFPNIVLISDNLVNQIDYNYVIVHEIAHQWWYGVVGNDEYNHAWQDEGLAEYSSLLFYKKNTSYGENFNDMLTSANNSYKLFEDVYARVQGSVDSRMERPLCEFETEPEYVQCTYTKGVLMFNNISDLIGEKKFIKALKEYCQKFKFKNAKPEDLIAIFVDFGGRKMENLINSWLNGNVVFK